MPAHPLPHPAEPRAAAPLPTYALYGERGRTEATDRLHCETIAERSARHAWEIRPHRHETLFQILYIGSGSLQAWLESGARDLRGPCALSVPALAPHGFRFSPDTDGCVVTVLEPHWRALLGAQDGLAERLAQPLVLQWPGGDAFDPPQGDAAGAPARAVAQAVQQLRDEFFGTAPWRDRALDAALLRLAVALARAAPEPDTGPAAGGERALRHVRRYRDLVEAQFRQQPTLAALAPQIGITATQLNRACHQVLGHSALGLLHGRLLLEAQRDLAYTRLSIKQIALGLGFGDAGYFTRFFQRLTGQTPTAWRTAAAR